MAAANKCLAQSNKSRTGGEATKTVKASSRAKVRVVDSNQRSGSTNPIDSTTSPTYPGRCKTAGAPSEVQKVRELTEPWRSYDRAKAA